jgi:hypothetical protein
MLRLSTALANFLASGGSLQKALHDGVIDIYNGTQPSDADNAPNALLLNRITYQGGSFTPGVPSTRQTDEIAITYGSDGNVYVLNINGTAYSYTAIAGDNATKVATALAALVDASSVVAAVSDVAKIVTRARYGGNVYTITNTGSTTIGNIVITNLVANARINGLQFSPAVAGVLSKEAGAWQGIAVASGLAGWGRFKANAVDDGSQSTALIRLDFAINSANSDMIALSSLNMVAAITSTIDVCILTIPKA